MKQSRVNRLKMVKVECNALPTDVRMPHDFVTNHNVSSDFCRLRFSRRNPRQWQMSDRCFEGPIPVNFLRR